MNRWKASGAHLLLSLILIGGIAISAFLLWYPWGLYRVAGVDRVLLIMLGIDVAAGPLLTLIVYKQDKRGLGFDLATIAALQILFLCYGLHTLCQARPVFLVGIDGQFTLVTANEVDPASLADAPPQLRRLSWTGPRLVGARMPVDPERRRQVMEEFMSGGLGLERTPHHYLEFTEVASELAATARSVEHGDIPKSAVRATGLPTKQVRWVEIASRHGGGLMLIEAETARPLRTIAR